MYELSFKTTMNIGLFQKINDAKLKAFK